VLTSDWDGVLDEATSAARAYFASLPDRRVYPDTTPDQIRAVVDVPLTDAGEPAVEVVARLARDVGPFVAAHSSGRYFGFVIGGLHPAAYGAELLVSTWDQNAGLYAPTPGVSIVEEVAARWMVELLGLPTGSSVGFVTGGQMANFTCLAAARDYVLREVGWDVEADGLIGAPLIDVVVSDESGQPGEFQVAAQRHLPATEHHRVSPSLLLQADEVGRRPVGLDREADHAGHPHVRRGQREGHHPAHRVCEQHQVTVLGKRIGHGLGLGLEPSSLFVGIVQLRVDRRHLDTADHEVGMFGEAVDRSMVLGKRRDVLRKADDERGANREVRDVRADAVEDAFLA
jgi:hypothetical protein